MKRFLIWFLPIGLVAMAGVAIAQNLSSCPTINCWEDGGAATALGDTVNIGGTLDIITGGTLDIAGTTVTATASEINQVADESAKTETVIATNVITAAESGKTMYLSAATEFVSTLPAPAAGLWFKFIIAAAPAGASYTVVTAASANIMIVHVVELDGATTAVDVAGPSTTDSDTITFTDAIAVVGDMVECTSDGTSWFCNGVVSAGTGAEPSQAS